MRRMVIVAISPLIFLFSIFINGCVLADFFVDSANEIKAATPPHRPFRIIIFILTMILSVIFCSLFCTIGCIRDGNLHDLRSFCKDLFSC